MNMSLKHKLKNV